MHIAVSLGVPDTADMVEEGEKSASSSWRCLAEDLSAEQKNKLVQNLQKAKAATTEDAGKQDAAKEKKGDAATEDTDDAAKDAKHRSSCAQQPKESKYPSPSPKRQPKSRDRRTEGKRGRSETSKGSTGISASEDKRGQSEASKRSTGTSAAASRKPSRDRSKSRRSGRSKKCHRRSKSRKNNESLRGKAQDRSQQRSRSRRRKKSVEQDDKWGKEHGQKERNQYEEAASSKDRYAEERGKNGGGKGGEWDRSKGRGREWGKGRGREWDHDTRSKGRGRECDHDKRSDENGYDKWDNDERSDEKGYDKWDNDKRSDEKGYGKWDQGSRSKGKGSRSKAKGRKNTDNQWSPWQWGHDNGSDEATSRNNQPWKSHWPPYDKSQGGLVASPKAREDASSSHHQAEREPTSKSQQIAILELLTQEQDDIRQQILEHQAMEQRRSQTPCWMQPPAGRPVIHVEGDVENAPWMRLQKRVIRQAGRHDPTVDIANHTSGQEMTVLEMTHKSGAEMTFCDSHHRCNQVETAMSNVRTAMGQITADATLQGFWQGMQHASRGTASTPSMPHGDSILQIVKR